MHASARALLLTATGALIGGTVWWVGHADLHPHAQLFVRVFGAVLLLASALPKLRNLDAFVELVHAYRLTPRPMTRILGRTVPFMEACAGILLLVGTEPGLKLGAGAGAFLMAVFTVAVTINLLRGRRHISCGCFGEGRDARLGPVHAVRTLTMLCAFLWLADGGAGFALPGVPWASAPEAGAPLVSLTLVLAATGVLAFRLTGEVAPPQVGFRRSTAPTRWERLPR